MAPCYFWIRAEETWCTSVPQNLQCPKTLRSASKTSVPPKFQCLKNLSDPKLQCPQNFSASKTSMPQKLQCPKNFSTPKTQCLHKSAQLNFPDHFGSTHISHSSTLNILGLSSTKNLQMKVPYCITMVNQLQ